MSEETDFGSTLFEIEEKEELKQTAPKKPLIIMGILLVAGLVVGFVLSVGFLSLLEVINWNPGQGTSPIDTDGDGITDED